MRMFATAAAGLGVALLTGACLANAQAPAGPPPGHGPQAPMSFFVTSAGLDGGNLGGIAGADAQCQSLAAAAGRGGVTWHAYLSTQGPGAVNARDRIGKGPWYNAKGQKIGSSVAQIHGDTIAFGRLGNAFGKQMSLTEKGEVVAGIEDTPSKHDILTGTQPDGRAYPAGEDKTCSNWTSNASDKGSAQVGHSDKQGRNDEGGSWNSTHASRGCSAPNLVATAGAGQFYCFAVN